MYLQFFFETFIKVTPDETYRCRIISVLSTMRLHSVRNVTSVVVSGRS